MSTPDTQNTTTMPTSLPPTSRAWVFTARGPPASVLSLKSRPTPTLPPPNPSLAPEGWILIKTAYAALNPAGLFHISLLPAFARAATSVPELDVSGTVVGAETPRFGVGDRVAAFLPAGFMWATGTGALAEYIAVPAHYAARVPEGVGMRDAAGVLLAGLCGRALVEAAGLRAGGRVLVNAAAGGIGSFAVQMAREAVGAEGYVVGVCSGRNVELVKSLGADEVLDYTAFSPLSKELQERFADAPFDAVLDAIGVQDLYNRCAGYLVEDGIYAAIGIKPAAQSLVSYVGAFAAMQANALWPRARWLGGTGRTWRGVTVLSATVGELEALLALLAEGKVRVVVGSEFRMEDVQKGYEILQSGRTTGKILIKVDEAAE